MPPMEASKRLLGANMLVLGLLIRLLASAGHKLGGDSLAGRSGRGQSYAAPPVGDHEKHNRQACGERKAGNVPRQPTETLRRRLGHDAFTIFLNEGLKGKVVR